MVKRGLVTFVDQKTLGEYVEHYRQYTRNAAAYWAQTDRPDFTAEWWLNIEHRNEITRRMLEKIPDLYSQKILALGAAHLVEEHLYRDMNLPVTRTDLCGELGGLGILAVDACDMPFEDASFDVIIFRQTIEHVLDERQCYREIVRVLKPQGWLFISTPNAYNMPPDGRDHVRGYSPQGFLEVLQSYGFEIRAKEGCVPNAFHSLLPLAMQGYDVSTMLRDFRETAELMKGQDWSYYTSSLLKVLCQKSC